MELFTYLSYWSSFFAVLPHRRRLLDLRSVLSFAEQSHPVMQSRRLEVEATSEEAIGARRRRLPSFSVTAETGTDNDSSSPTQVVRVEQTLWDGGRVGAGIALADANVDSAREGVSVQQWNLKSQIIGTWQELLEASCVAV